MGNFMDSVEVQREMNANFLIIFLKSVWKVCLQNGGSLNKKLAGFKFADEKCIETFLLQVLAVSCWKFSLLQVSINNTE